MTQTRVHPTANDDDARLSLEAFECMAQRLGVDRELWEELYPMVGDLLAFATRLNRLAPELGQEMDLTASGDVSTILA